MRGEPSAITADQILHLERMPPVKKRSPRPNVETSRRSVKQFPFFVLYADTELAFRGIAVSRSVDVDAEACKSAGFLQSLQKPIDFEELEAAVASAMSKPPCKRTL